MSNKKGSKQRLAETCKELYDIWWSMYRQSNVKTENTHPSIVELCNSSTLVHDFPTSTAPFTNDMNPPPTSKIWSSLIFHRYFPWNFSMSRDDSRGPTKPSLRNTTKYGTKKGTSTSPAGRSKSWSAWDVAEDHPTGKKWQVNGRLMMINNG